MKKSCSVEFYDFIRSTPKLEILKQARENGNSTLFSFVKNSTKNELIKWSKLLCKHYHTFWKHPQCFIDAFGIRERTGVFDIEPHQLTADYGLVSCYVIKEYHKNVFYDAAITEEDVMKDEYDKNVIKKLCDDLKHFDRIITYYGTRFDIPFCRARALKWKLPFPVFAEVKHTDLYYVVKHKLALRRNSLRIACDHFDIPAKKIFTTPEMAWKKLRGDEATMKKVLAHCREDVISTEKLYDRLQMYFPVNKRSI